MTEIALVPPSEEMVNLLGSGDYALVEATLRGRDCDSIRGKFALVRVTGPNSEQRVLRHASEA